VTPPCCPYLPYRGPVCQGLAPFFGHVKTEAAWFFSPFEMVGIQRNGGSSCRRSLPVTIGATASFVPLGSCAPMRRSLPSPPPERRGFLKFFFQRPMPHSFYACSFSRRRKKQFSNRRPFPFLSVRKRKRSRCSFRARSAAVLLERRSKHRAAYLAAGKCGEARNVSYCAWIPLSEDVQYSAWEENQSRGNGRFVAFPYWHHLEVMFLKFPAIVFPLAASRGRPRVHAPAIGVKGRADCSVISPFFRGWEKGSSSVPPGFLYKNSVP